MLLSWKRIVLMALSMSVWITGCASEQPAAKPNVLFISVDDLNDWVGCLGGHPQVQTPNIDKLAGRGVLFENAQCQAPICNPSRASYLTGLLPSTSGVYQLAPDFRSAPELHDRVTLPQHFHANGYQTISVGKVFHGSYPDEVSFEVNGPRPGFGPLPKEKLHYKEGHPLWDWGAVFTDEEMGDAKVTNWFVEELSKLDGSRPFFFAVGFYRPHVPMYAPQRWFDLYPPDSVKLPPTMEGDRDDLPEFAKQLTNGLPAPRHEWFVKNNQWHEAVRSYLASNSFVDNQVGRVLNALWESKFADNTIVVLLSDHGWHLGEKERWAKRSLWERTARVPLIISVPGGLQGAKCSRPAGLVDLYPTLVELCGLPAKDGLDGQSLKPLLEDPAAEWERPAITTFEKNNHALRSENFRYISYADGSEELYDHRTDPNEWHNLAGDLNYKDIIEQHKKWLPAVNNEPVPGSVDSAAENFKKRQNKPEGE